MNPTALLVMGMALAGLAAADPAHAQLGIGEAATVRGIDVTIEDFDRIRVVHEVAGGDSVRGVPLFEGTVSNIEVVDGRGDAVEHGVTSGFGPTQITLFPSGADVFVRYDLRDVMFKNQNVTWTWDFVYPVTTTFHLPESTDIAFVNERPVYFKSARTFNCHGCDMMLEFVPGEKRITETVRWEDREFDIEVLGSTELGGFNFSQSAKSISYDFDDSERWVTLIIPLELLWNPYQAWLDDEKIFTHEFRADAERVGVSLKLDEPGTVTIVGTSVIPEFPVLVPLMMAGLAAAVLLHRGGRIIPR